MNLIELITELKKLNFEVDVLKSIFSELEKNDDDVEINIGSRVLIKWEHGRDIKGRVVGKKSDGSFYVNRDGYSGTIAVGINKTGLTKHSLENLSVGAYGKLDQRLWYSQKEILKIEDLIKKKYGMNGEEFANLIDK